MSLRLWPKNYEGKDFITAEEKRLLKGAARNFVDGHFAIDIDPMGCTSAGSKMGLFISPSEGLITFSILKGDVEIDNVNAYLLSIKFYEDIIYDRLLDSMALIARNGEKKVLKFPYKHIIVFPSAEGVKAFPQGIISVLSNRVYRSFFRPIDSQGKERRISDLKIFSGIEKSYDGSFSGMTELECRCIFERLAPEYSVIISENEPVFIPTTSSISEEDMLITGNEVEYKTFFLDEYQVGIVNEMGKGHRVVLANPGAGKSVLLLSKAFKYSKMYKGSKILLTCYNNNLANSYLFKHECAGFVTQNLYIMTFHRLVKKIYEECLGTPKVKIEDEDIAACISFIKRGKVKLDFKAIFVDEVQIFDPQYLELCFLLLDKKDNDYTFLMAGDLNQKIRSSSKRGDAPWKNMKGINLDFTGRVRYIEKNYRNSKQISEYISKMLELMNKRFSALEMISSFEYEYNSFKLGEKKTIALEVTQNVPKSEIQSTVINAVDEISTKYKTAFNDIAILFPYRRHSLAHYYFLDWIKKGLDEKEIPYSVIIRSDDHPVRYSDTSGVVLSTIESSLGLDFKAVIVAGLKPYDFVVDDSQERKVSIPVKSWAAIKEMSAINKERVQNQMRSVYTACSRAREILYVISDLKPNTPMDEIIRK